MDRANNREILEINNYKKGSWKEYSGDAICKDLQREGKQSPAQLLSDFYRRLLSAADTWIPKYKPRKFYNKPWWSSECHKVWRERERLYRRYKRTCTNTDKEAWLSARGLATRTFKVSKQEQWRTYVTSLNENTRQ